MECVAEFETLPVLFLTSENAGKFPAKCSGNISPLNLAEKVSLNLVVNLAKRFR